MDAWGALRSGKGSTFILRTLVNRCRETALSTNITRSAHGGRSKGGSVSQNREAPSEEVTYELGNVYASWMMER